MSVIFFSSYHIFYMTSRFLEKDSVGFFILKFLFLGFSAHYLTVLVQSQRSNKELKFETHKETKELVENKQELKAD